MIIKDINNLIVSYGIIHQFVLNQSNIRCAQHFLNIPLTPIKIRNPRNYQRFRVYKPREPINYRSAGNGSEGSDSDSSRRRRKVLKERRQLRWQSERPRIMFVLTANVSCNKISHLMNRGEFIIANR